VPSVDDASFEMDQIDLKVPHVTRQSSGLGSGQAWLKRLPILGLHIKLFGAMTCLTMSIVVCMSIYVVYSNEVRFTVKGDRLTNLQGATLITAQQEATVDNLFDVLQLETDRLRHLEALAFFVRLPDGEIAQIMLKIDRIMRFTNSGRTEICSSSGACILTSDDDDPTKLNATFTDVGRHCPSLTSCTVIFDGPQGELARRHLSAVRRQLAWWNPFSWFSTPPPSPPPPAWQATDTCPWICKQGWWWEETAYAKPACCMETKDSGSPYETCEYERCQCDASCASCCTG